MENIKQRNPILEDPIDRIRVIWNVNVEFIFGELEDGEKTKG